MSTPYDTDAAKRPVNLSLNADLVRRVRLLTGNLSEQVERLLADYLVAEHTRRHDAQAELDRALVALSEFAERGGSFSDAHSTL